MAKGQVCRLNKPGMQESIHRHHILKQLDCKGNKATYCTLVLLVFIVTVSVCDFPHIN